MRCTRCTQVEHAIILVCYLHVIQNIFSSKNGNYIMIMYTRSITYFNCVPVVSTYEVIKDIKISTQYRLYLFVGVKPICLLYYVTVMR